MELADYCESNVSFSSLTTFGVGGPARLFATPLSVSETVECVRWAADSGVPICVIGGGSNVLVSESGFDGLVIQSADFAIDVVREGSEIVLTVGAGVEWDELVAFCVDEGFVGLECLSGIPGRVGAAPVQNIGAYGQEVAGTIERVDVINRSTCMLSSAASDSCGFGYRRSYFKTAWRDRYLIARVVFRLRTDVAPDVRYEELRKALGMEVPGMAAPELSTVRDMVLRIRRRKSMIYDTDDPNHRSVGSFFTNPLVDAETVEAIRERTEAGDSLPSWPAVDGLTKLSAAWLIEHAGFERGFVFGKAGISSRHTLALINRGGARADDIIALASIVRRRVRESFGVSLTPEPVFLGFDRSVDELLG